jgi:hypothetical protein
MSLGIPLHGRTATVASDADPRDVFLERITYLIWRNGDLLNADFVAIVQGQFQTWARLAMSWAADLAPYQSPTFRAISISHQKDDEQRDRGTTVLHSLDQVKELLLLRGVSPEQFGRALIEPMPPLIEHEDHGEKKR